METTRDKFLNGRFELIQPKKGYRAGIDPIFLASAVPARRGDTVLDVGCGAGAASLALITRCPGITVRGIDCQEDLIEMYRDNIKNNSYRGTVRGAWGDFFMRVGSFYPQSFKHVMTNPPYFEEKRSSSSSNLSKEKAKTEHVESWMTRSYLEEWLVRCITYLKPKGTLTLIHRFDRISEILHVLDKRVGNITVFPLYGTEDKHAKLVIVQATKFDACKKIHIESQWHQYTYMFQKTEKSSNPMFLKGMVLNDRYSGRYTPEAEEILRNCNSLSLYRY